MDVGSVIRKQWEILQKIGHGGFGQIYAAKDLLTQKIVAIKVEEIIPKKQSLKLETLVLNKMQASRYSPRFFYFGKHDNCYYLVMELLGKNLADLRRRTTDKKFSLSTTLLLSIDMISAIEDIHKIGYVHRDIKPSNFVWRPRKGKKVKTKFARCCLIDFGLARKYRLTDGKLRPPRETAGFRGTARYASITSHKSKELGRVDDLWSLFYVLVECIKGVLPWSNLQEKNEIFQSKLKFQNSKLCEGTHQSFHLFLEHLQGLGFEDPPNYDYLRGLMIECFRESGFKYAEREGKKGKGGTRKKRKRRKEKRRKEEQERREKEEQERKEKEEKAKRKRQEEKEKGKRKKKRREKEEKERKEKKKAKERKKKEKKKKEKKKKEGKKEKKGRKKEKERKEKEEKERKEKEEKERKEKEEKERKEKEEKEKLERKKKKKN